MKDQLQWMNKYIWMGYPDKLVNWNCSWLKLFVEVPVFLLLWSNKYCFCILFCVCVSIRNDYWLIALHGTAINCNRIMSQFDIIILLGFRIKLHAKFALANTYPFAFIYLFCYFTIFLLSWLGNNFIFIFISINQWYSSKAIKVILSNYN